MMKRWLLVLVALTIGLQMHGQGDAPAKYWVSFADKDQSPYCLCRPAELLSARALERRSRAGLALDAYDLPVNPGYVEGLRQEGASIHLTSRWLNGAAVIADAATAARLGRLPFVTEVQYVGPDLPVRHAADARAAPRPVGRRPPRPVDSGNPFGYAALQLSQLGIPALHYAGHRGEGIWIAVLDGGFTGVDTLPFFDSVALSGRLFQVRDLVERDNHVFEGSGHGTAVLSAMAANVPGYLMGAAPDAAYFLFKTEDTGGEFPIEACNWVAAAEYADSLGVDILNASLGYTTFNDTTLNYRYADMDGRTTIGSRGAAIAASRGMIVCNSAGNNGADAWRHIGAPADAPGVLAVGAVDPDGERSGFSSIGPSSDGRIKPDLVAPGGQVVVAGSNAYDLGISSGTSLASPLLAGGLAALWSAFPEKTAREILLAVFESADQAADPSNHRGFGLPDLGQAWARLSGFAHKDGHVNRAGIGFFASDPVSGTMQVWTTDRMGEPESVYLTNMLGQKIPVSQSAVHQQRITRIALEGTQHLPRGAYHLQVISPLNTVQASILQF
jgi:serine protease AprX